MRIVFDIVSRRITMLLALSLVLAGCAGPKIAADLLTNVKPNDRPTSSSGYEVSVTINPNINNFEGIDASVQESLDMALTSAKIFSPDAASKYKIKAHILTASQAAMSFGSFEGKLEIRYTVVDPSGKDLFEKTIYTIAGSDHWSFSGAARHQRARAVNIAKNVLEFVDFLRTRNDISYGEPVLDHTKLSARSLDYFVARNQPGPV
jgi:hypothetical protein